MKKLLLSIALISAMTIGISSCNSDDDTPPGKFTFDGKTFQGSRGYAILEGTLDDGDDIYYHWSVYLTSSGIHFSSDDKEWKGEGEAVLLFLTALNDDSLLPLGTYDSDKGDGDCAVYIDFDVENGSGDKYEDIESTSFTIDKSGSAHTITFTTTLASGEAVSGSFKGSISEIEY